MIKWLLNKLFKGPKIEGYRLIGVEERRKEEEIKINIWRNFKRRMKDGK